MLKTQREGPDVLSAPLGDCLVLARPGPQPGQRLQVLDPLAAWIWQSYRAGLTPPQIAAHLSSHFSLPLDQALADVASLLETWQDAPSPFAWTVRLADRRILVRVEDPALAARLGPWLRHVADDSEQPPDTQLHLLGVAQDWSLLVDDAVSASGQTLDEALVRTRSALIEVGCHAPHRLLVLHAAGVSRAGQGVLLIGRGGAGKTTLATALNATGWALLNDDVIPVTLDGQLLGLGLGPCLKAGSWPVLAGYLPDLDQAPVVRRLNQPVRFPPPPGPIVHGPLPTAAFLMPRYQPGSKPACEPLDPVRILQAIIAAEAVLPTLDQPRLEALIRWVGSAPGFALTYPDLDGALDLIAGLPLKYRLR